MILIGLAACSSSSPQTPKYDEAGQYGVGVHTYMFVDTSRTTPANGTYPELPSRTLQTEVWYPSTMPSSPGEEAMREAPAASGTFPLIVHSHGFMDSRNGEGYLGRHLASRGYIVAAPDFPLSNSAANGGPTITDLPNQPGDVSFVIDQVLATLSVDSAHIGISGLSLGGATTLLAAFHDKLRDKRVGAALPIAPLSCMFTAQFFGNSLPVLFLQGDADMIAPTAQNSERVFPEAQAPKELILLKAGSHTGFSGFASLFDPTMNYDRIGCMALGDIAVPPTFDGLGTADDGINPDTSVCPAPCQGTFVDPSLNADRQTELTKIIGAAFFDGWLLEDKAAQKYLQGAVAKENPEVSITLK
jgi:predicted dienelactone hydrolase